MCIHTEWVARVLAAALVMAMGACSGSGPSGRDLLSGGVGADSTYALVDIDENNIEIVSRWHRPSLGAMYGDYRAASVQRVGVGDSLQITIWEAGGSGIFATANPSRTDSGSRPAAIPEQSVAKDGTIQVPFAGRIKVDGKTPQQIEDLIVKRLEAKASQPQVS
jgi:polysaccharide export outer membrane protein